jgi:hypothetical protein
MTEQLYNLSWGQGLEGVIKYVNEGLFSTAVGIVMTTFLCVIYGIMLYILSKSEWKMSANLVFSTFAILILSMVVKLFTHLSERFIFVLAIILAGSIVWSILEGASR